MGRKGEEYVGIRGGWVGAAISQPTTSSVKFPISAPSQLTEALTDSQEGGSQSHFRGQDIPKDQGHSREGSSSRPCHPEFLE